MQDKWVAVTVTQNLVEAHIIAGRLEVEGLMSRVHQAAIGAIYGLTIGKEAEVEVLVPQSQLEDARRILSDTPEDDFDNSADDE